MGECDRTKGWKLSVGNLARSLCSGSPLHPSASRDRDVPFLGCSESTPPWRVLRLALGERVREGVLLAPAFLKFFEPKIFNMPRCYVLGQHALNPIKSNLQSLTHSFYITQFDS